MTIVVTGGVGYLGSLLIRELPDHPAFAGETIRIVDNFRQARFNSLWDLPRTADYEFTTVDIRDRDAVAEAIGDADTVFHLAAITNAPETFDIPEQTRAVNYDGAMNVYETARRAGVSEFVNVSTCSVYGTTDEEITEDSACDPESPYGEAKLAAEQEMLDRHSGEMETTALRLGTVYGWTEGMRFDTVVNKFALLAATGRPLTVYRGAEDQKRPYLHARDAVRAMLFAADRLGDGAVYNVVGENGRLQDVVDAVTRYFPDVEVTHTEAEQLNQLSYVVSDERIHEEGFRTTYSIDQGTKALADKFRAFL